MNNVVFWEDFSKFSWKDRRGNSKGEISLGILAIIRREACGLRVVAVETGEVGGS